VTTNRRKFLRTGALAAIAAAIPFNASGQGIRKGSDGNPIDSNPPELAPDALANYNKAAFTSYLNSVFRLYTGYFTVDVALVEVKDLMPAGIVAKDGAECFSLLFRGGNVALPQNTYRIEHPALGVFPLFLVPGGADESGGQSYVAIVNRLAYSPALLAAPSRSTKTATPNSNALPSLPASTSLREVTEVVDMEVSSAGRRCRPDELRRLGL
jgi:hypothetical protein